MSTPRRPAEHFLVALAHGTWRCHCGSRGDRLATYRTHLERASLSWRDRIRLALRPVHL